MANSDTISFTPEETESIVNAINLLTNGVAGINNSIKAGITPKTIDAAARSLAQLLVIAGAGLGPGITMICGLAAGLA
jgi:hypothetical protein